jgi:hypothetical protein
MLMLALSAAAASAQEPRQSPATAGEEAGELEHRNEVAAIVAGTSEIDGDTFFTLGVEYERRLTQRVGIVGEVEYLFDAERWIAVAPIVLHAGRGLKVFGGPGFEVADTEEIEEVQPEIEEGETHFLLRVGAAYALEFAERYSVGPTVSFDFIRENDEWEHAVVFGISFGVGF